MHELKEGHLRKLGSISRVSVCAITGLYLPLILISPYVPDQVKAVYIYSTAIYSVNAALPLPGITQHTNRPNTNACFCFSERTAADALLLSQTGSRRLLAL